jgi:hypothetical protein
MENVFSNDVQLTTKLPLTQTGLCRAQSCNAELCPRPLERSSAPTQPLDNGWPSALVPMK